MGKLNQAKLIGTVREDPVFVTHGNKYRYAIITVATDDSYRNAKGEAVEVTDLHRVRVFGDRNPGIIEEMHKTGKLTGAEVYIEGRIKALRWEGKNKSLFNLREIVVTRPHGFQALNDNTDAGEAIEAPVKMASWLMMRIKRFKAFDIMRRIGCPNFIEASLRESFLRMDLKGLSGAEIIIISLVLLIKAFGSVRRAKVSRGGHFI
jgi:single-strand DNA-binding protein